MGGRSSAELARFAAQVAAEDGAFIEKAWSSQFEVEYKDQDGIETNLNHPVTEIDRIVEERIRMRLAARFPEDDVLGEEGDSTLTGSEYLWAVDPIDGTANFANGYPLFATSIGVLRRGRPVAGAIWCAASHALRSGVYHAPADGPLSFDGTPLARQVRPGLRRRLSGITAHPPEDAKTFDPRISGSAAIECAFVACGILAVARFDHVNLWDIAGGAALVLAAGGLVAIREGEEWVHLTDVGENVAGWSGQFLVAADIETARDVLCAEDPAGRPHGRLPL